MLFVARKNRISLKKNKEIHSFNDSFKMNKIINKVLLTGEKFVQELHLKQSARIYLQCLWTKHLERIKKFRETVIKTFSLFCS